MRKKWLALALSMAMVVGSITGCGGSDSNKDASNSSKSNDSAKVETVADGGGKVLNIYVWNTEFKERFEKYYPACPPVTFPPAAAAHRRPSDRPAAPSRTAYWSRPWRRRGR